MSKLIRIERSIAKYNVSDEHKVSEDIAGEAKFILSEDY